MLLIMTMLYKYTTDALRENSYLFEGFSIISDSLELLAVVSGAVLLE